MALREIVKIGDEVLRLRAKEVTEFDQSLAQLIDDMAETMYHNQGVGLAAPQVSILKRVVVIDVGVGLIELVNPKITKTGPLVPCEEGCLSIPGKRGKVMRPQYLTVEGFDRHGNKVKYDAEGYFAQAVAHELDHLDGVLYIDKVIEGTLHSIDPED
ncbi:MAG TPA: peptide deformylase [Clostridia bacterium]